MRCPRAAAQSKNPPSSSVANGAIAGGQIPQRRFGSGRIDRGPLVARLGHRQFAESAQRVEGKLPGRHGVRHIFVQHAESYRVVVHPIFQCTDQRQNVGELSSGKEPAHFERGIHTQFEMSEHRHD